MAWKSYILTFKGNGYARPVYRGVSLSGIENGASSLNDMVYAALGADYLEGSGNELRNVEITLSFEADVGSAP